jgi:hypothetical protein
MFLFFAFQSDVNVKSTVKIDHAYRKLDQHFLQTIPKSGIKRTLWFLVFFLFRVIHIYLRVSFSTLSFTGHFTATKYLFQVFFSVDDIYFVHSSLKKNQFYKEHISDSNVNLCKVRLLLYYYFLSLFIFAETETLFV